jgi:hypothetical protein
VLQDQVLVPFFWSGQNQIRRIQFLEAGVLVTCVGFEFQDHGIPHSIYFDDPDNRPLEITTYDVPARL